MSDNSYTDYDAWTRGDVPGHIRSIREALADLQEHSDPQAVEEARRSQENRRAQFVVQRDTGRVGSHDLCWVCFADTTWVDKRLPNFRACQNCVEVDRRYAARLNRKMLLPLMDYHSPPILRSQQEPVDPRVVEWLAKLWSEVHVLLAWKIAGIRNTCLSFPSDYELNIFDWKNLLEPGVNRSRNAWWSYLTGNHQPLSSYMQNMT